MKNHAAAALAALTILFVGVIIGFSLGRHVTKAPIQVQIIQQPTAPAVTAPAATAPAVLTGPAETVPVPIGPAETVPLPTEPVGSGLININTADIDTLCLLPGIGPVLAQRIIDYRTQHGPFSSLEELTLVEGIGAKRLEAIQDFAVTGG